MSLLQEVNKEISKLKTKLIKEAKTKGLYENFGNKETRQLRDKFFLQAFGNSIEQRQAMQAITDFELWCMEYTG